MPIEVLEPRTLLSAVGFAASTQNSSEGQRQVPVELHLDVPSAQAVQVTYAIVNGSAKAGSDFSLSSDGRPESKASGKIAYEGTVEFAAGQTTQTILVNVADDQRREGDETFRVIVTAANGADAGQFTTLTYTIQDNDGIAAAAARAPGAAAKKVKTPVVSFAATGATVNEGVGTTQIAVKLSGTSTQTVTINYSITSGTATGGGVDYTLASGTLTFTPGTTTQNISVPIVDNATFESTESLTLTLSSPVNGKLKKNTSFTLTIQDNDVAPVQLTANEVQQLLQRGAAASDSNDAIIVVVDREGNILGVRVESAVTPADSSELVFMIDGAVAVARSAAFFSSNAAPLTSRTVRVLSESTITQREVESNPNITDPDSTIRGPGTVAPIGVGGHFPPGIQNVPPVDLFDIEHTNRDSLLNPGADHIKGTADDIVLPSRFNADYIAGQDIAAPESYGYQSGILTTAQSRGIGTLPGGIPLYRDTNGDGVGDTLIGAVGVFFPGPDGYATFEQGFVPGVGQTAEERKNAPRALEAEFIAFAAAGGSTGAGAPVGSLDGVAPVAGIDLPFGRIDLGGLALEGVGPTPGIQGVRELLKFSKALDVGAAGSSTSGADQIVDPANDLYLPGQAVPDGWLVAPHDSLVDDLTAADVQQIIEQGIAEADLVRAAIRFPIGARTRMIFAVTDTNGEVLGLYRMPDATYFSLAVAVAKGRNTAYYADPAALQPQDQLPGVPDGVAFSNRTFRFLAEPRYPAGIDGQPPPFSILNDPGVNPATAENLGAPVAASSFQTVLGYTRFNPEANFRDPDNVENQNGVVFFPGSAPVYKNGVLVGGFGVSGDGVDQDDAVTDAGSQGFLVPDNVLRADDIIFNGVRLPYQNFPRNPHA